MAVVRMAPAVIVVAVIAIAGCHGAQRAKVTWPDTPVELRDDSDRDAAIDHLWVMPLGPERDRARAAIADAIVRRISDAVVEERPFAAGDLLDELMMLWQLDPDQIGTGLARHTGLLRQLRAMFAKSGMLEPTVQTLVVLSLVEPDQKTQHLAELDEVLAFADELAVSENGPNATRAQPIDLLQSTVLSLPLPWLVDRYVTMLIERQRTVSQLLDKQGASMELVRAHHDILSTSRRIANALARANRPLEIHRYLANIKGIGADRDLTMRAEILAEHPTAESYLELASLLRNDEHAPDPGAALAVCMAGLAKFPNDAELLAAAGGDARSLGRVDQAIALHEQALHGSSEVDTALALRLGKLYGDRIGRLAASGRPQAAHSAWHDVITFTARVSKRHPSVVWQQAAAIAESALGKGLASQGLVDDGRRALRASIERAPSIDAYETLTTIDGQVARYSDAQRWAAAGIQLLGTTTTGDRYRRAKLERLAADAMRQAGKSRDAASHYLESLRAWASLGEEKDLPRSVAAERLLESGRAMWWLGDAARAVELVMAAVDKAESPEVFASAVAFLIEAGRYRDALDAYHRGLGEPDGSELYNVYTSLWILGEAKRLGEPRDRIASDYLANRRGDLWYELLARCASGKLSFDALRAAATTGPRKGELAFYGAVLGLDPQAATPEGRRKLLREVVDARAVLDAEYDLARTYLAAP
ncbi:MAG TPA: hypothetical protein VFQ53_21450 [Kofleriaceae bacterium]|nr:hypothetical protein [Kofleriaceae bacterium]